jgi:hypothetical protein
MVTTNFMNIDNVLTHLCRGQGLNQGHMLICDLLRPNVALGVGEHWQMLVEERQV